jgi:hypothetical protein
VTTNINSSVEEHFVDQVMSYNEPAEMMLFPPYPIYVQTNLSSVQFSEGNITAQALSSAYATSAYGTVRIDTFIDTDTAISRLFPPSTSWIPDINEKPVDGLRVSSEFLTAVTQLANTLGYLQDGMLCALQGGADDLHSTLILPLPSCAYRHQHEFLGKSILREIYEVKYFGGCCCCTMLWTLS